MTINDCFKNPGSCICILIIFIAGILGIVFSSIEIDKTKKLKNKGKSGKFSMGCLIAMLILSILITLAALINGVELYSSKKSMEKYYKKILKMFK